MFDTQFVLPEGIFVEELNDKYGRFVYVPLERGYGITVGNALRRVLLSSIPGYSIVAMRIDGITHEFSTIPGVMEEVPQIVLNLKGIRLRLDEEVSTTATLYIRAEGAREVKAGDIDVPEYVEIVNPEHHIATLTRDDARFYAELIVAKGRGYIPANEMSKEGFPAGTIFIDGVFSPIVKVNYTVENVRVKARTDYEKLILEIWTDGTIKPDTALEMATKTLLKSIEPVLKKIGAPYGKDELKFEEKEKIHQILSKSIDFLEPSKRTANCLKDAGIETIAQLVSKTEEEILQVKNFGEKSLEEIKEKLERFGLSFGMDISKYLGEEETKEVTDEA